MAYTSEMLCEWKFPLTVIKENDFSVAAVTQTSDMHTHRLQHQIRS